MPAVEYDGVAEFWVESIEHWQKLWTDEEFLKGVAGKDQSMDICSEDKLVTKLRR
jgi:hypothetical protein